MSADVKTNVKPAATVKPGTVTAFRAEVIELIDARMQTIAAQAAAASSIIDRKRAEAAWYALRQLREVIRQHPIG